MTVSVRAVLGDRQQGSCQWKVFSHSGILFGSEFRRADSDSPSASSNLSLGEGACSVRRRAVAFVFFLVLDLQITAVRADEPLLLCAADPKTQYCLQKLVGSNSKVRRIDLRHQNRLRGQVDFEQTTLFVSRNHINPISAERLKNQGHHVEYLEAPSRDSGGLATCILLRSLCKKLVRLYPGRADEFHARLASLECEIRLRAQVPAFHPLVEQA